MRTTLPQESDSETCDGKGSAATGSPPSKWIKKWRAPSAATLQVAARDQGRFALDWSRSMQDERLHLYTLSRHGFANVTQEAALSNLAERGLIRWRGGLPELRNKAFGTYVDSLNHSDLMKWRNEGHRNMWRTIWPVAVTLLVLVSFVILNASPETFGLLVAASTAIAGLSPLQSLLSRAGGSVGQANGGDT